MSDRKLIHTITIPVRWGDMDAFGHVNNATYFTFCEQTRVNWLETSGLAESVRTVSDQGPVIVNASCTFLRPVVYPATIEVSMFAGAIGRSSLETEYEIRDAEDREKLYTTGSAKIVWIDHNSGRSMALPDSVRALVSPA